MDSEHRRTKLTVRMVLLLEEDVVLLPEPGVGQVARIGLCLAREEGVTGDVHCDVFWR